jgi:hypothetical protein
MSTAVSLAKQLTHTPPQPLFAGCGLAPAAWEYHYDVMPDGGRSLWRCSAAGADAGTVTVNWQSTLDR